MLFSSIDQFMHSIVSYTENLQNFSFITSGSIKMYQNFLIGRINLPQTYPKKNSMKISNYPIDNDKNLYKHNPIYFHYIHYR